LGLPPFRPFSLLERFLASLVLLPPILPMKAVKNAMGITLLQWGHLSMLVIILSSFAYVKGGSSCQSHSQGGNGICEEVLEGEITKEGRLPLTGSFPCCSLSFGR